jgi:dTDP-4-dehydrorhamnose reductase
MTWLITGGTGQLGLALQNELKTRDIDQKSLSSNDLDVSDSLAVEKLVQLIRPDVVINAAAWTDVDGAESHEKRTFEVNAQGALNLATTAKQIGAKIVQVSTDFVFSGANTSPWEEKSPHNPLSVYGASKSLGEQLVRSTHPDGSYIIRTAWLYSADRKNFAKTMTKFALLDDSHVRVVYDQVGQPTFAGDLAKQIVDMVVTNAPFGVYHGTNSGEATWFDFTLEIFKLAGADTARVIPISSMELQRSAKRPPYSVLGHNAWNQTAISPMRSWQSALTDSFPAVLNTVKVEG